MVKRQKTQILELNLGAKSWKQKILEDYILVAVIDGDYFYC